MEIMDDNMMCEYSVQSHLPDLLHSKETNKLVVDCDFTWIVGYDDKTTPVYCGPMGGFKVFFLSSLHLYYICFLLMFS
jgi:hypothetical protein